MRIRWGHSYPKSGSATVAGLDVYKQQEQIKKNIGYMSQKFSLYDNLTVWENIEFYGGVYGVSRAEIKRRSSELVETLGLEKEAKKLVAALPLGWKQQLTFSVAIEIGRVSGRARVGKEVMYKGGAVTLKKN